MSAAPSGESRKRRWWICALVAAILAAGLGYAGRRAYCKWQPQKLAAEARGFLERGDFRNAALIAGRALQINVNDLASTRVMAEVNEKIGAPETVLWRRRVSQLNPGSAADSLRWAASALRFHEYQAAAQALDTVAPTHRSSAEFHGTAGAVAVGLGRAEDAAHHFAAACKLDPENETAQYNHAAAQLMAGGSAVRDTARVTLEKLCASPRYGVLARRVLMSDSLAHREHAKALSYAAELLRDPEATFGDRLSHLDLLQRSHSPEAEGALARLKTAAASSPGDAGALIAWLNQNQQPSAGVEYARTLPEIVRESVPVAMALAPCHESLRDWTNLKAVAKKAAWRGHDHLRFAYLAKAMRELGDEGGAGAQWNAAVAATSRNSEAAKRLLQLIARWKWDDAIPALLWATLHDSPNAPWALARLYRHYQDRQDTRGLQQVTARMIELDPTNEVLKNNHALGSLLLKENLERAFATARELYVANPANPIAVTTYAYALHVHGRSAEALQLMNTLTNEQLNEPATAAYYAVVLAANKAPDVARLYAEKAAGARLLPEEKELVAKVEGSERRP